MAAGKVKVVMRGNSWTSSDGDVVLVDKDTAEFLIRERHADAVSDAAKKLEAEIEATAPPVPPA